MSDRIRIHVGSNPLDTAKALEFVADETAGGTCLFVGSTRSRTGDRHTMSLWYEAHETMALKELERLAIAALREWRVHRIFVAHRLGHVGAGEASVVVAVSAAHRDEAFVAARALIDRLKESVPIWKRETYRDGSVEWVDPLG